jgi:hypothetical protein
VKLHGGTVMTIDRRLLALIGRRNPAIYDVIPRGGQLVSLNPQPIPPGVLGELAAAELLRIGWLAERFSLDLGAVADELDDWCPTYPKRPKLPHWWPPIPDPEPHPDWMRAYYLGFASRLAAVSGEMAGTKLQGVTDAALERSIASLEASLG